MTSRSAAFSDSSSMIDRSATAKKMMATQSGRCKDSTTGTTPDGVAWEGLSDALALGKVVLLCSVRFHVPYTVIDWRVRAFF